MPGQSHYAKEVRERDTAPVSTINRAAREINCKLVYYGPGMGGKTTNLQFIYDQLPDERRSRMISLATEGERTLFFDFLPVELGQVRGFRTRFHLYTVPGQVLYNESRKLILRNVDGVVFVADSQERRLDANLESLDDLEENLAAYGVELASLPYILQINKRDLPDALPMDELTAQLQRHQEPVIQAVARQGDGVLDSLRAVSAKVLAQLAGS
jgi:signal recognition particle receptor subunit beta